MASKKDIARALRAFENLFELKKGHPSPYVATVDEAIEVLLYLELCIPVQSKPRVYQIPALLNDSIPDGTWVEDAEFDVYRGQRYECDRPVDIISPSSFVILQSRCYHMPNVSYEAWKDGLKLTKIANRKVVIQCFITMGIKKEHHCIDVILRWSSKDDCEAVAKEFVDELKPMIAAVCDERSPRVILSWFYLHSSHLKQLDEDPAIYSSHTVDQKVNDKALDDKLFSVRPEKKIFCCVRDLVINVAGTTTSASGRTSITKRISLINSCV